MRSWVPYLPAFWTPGSVQTDVACRSLNINKPWWKPTWLFASWLLYIKDMQITCPWPSVGRISVDVNISDKRKRENTIVRFVRFLVHLYIAATALHNWDIVLVHFNHFHWIKKCGLLRRHWKYFVALKAFKQNLVAVTHIRTNLNTNSIHTWLVKDDWSRSMNIFNSGSAGFPCESINGEVW